MNIDEFRWHEVPTVLWINAINWILIMAKRLMVLNRLSYSCHIINSTYKVIDNLHGSLSEVLVHVSQCLVDLTQPNLIISTVMKFLAWIFNFPMLIILRFKKKMDIYCPNFIRGEAPNDLIYQNLFAEKK